VSAKPWLSIETFRSPPPRPANAGGIEWNFGRKRGLGYERPQRGDLLMTLGLGRRDPAKARALRAPIDPSISKGCTEAEPSCSASNSRPTDRRRHRSARLLQRRGLQWHRSHGEVTPQRGSCAPKMLVTAGQAVDG
jgi:hypothetical protein